MSDEISTTAHYYTTSHAGTVEEIAGLIRGHRSVESMRWVLDVVFREDDSRVRAGHAGENLALIRRVAVSLLRRAPGKGSTPTKRSRPDGTTTTCFRFDKESKPPKCGSPTPGVKPDKVLKVTSEEDDVERPGYPDTIPLTKVKAR